ncbi:MAG: EAL domain-containing protein [Lachnospiraceae bacterium]|nr:EAL domain-containing protein [Lachnospiraceae bacterium]
MGKTISINLVGKEEFEDVMRVFARCTDDYLFLFDLDKDEYIISEKALEKFDLPDNHFSNAGEVLEKIIYPEDMPGLTENLAQLRSGESQEHDLEYRWVDRNGKIVWISCRGVVIQDSTKEEETKLLIGRVTEIGSKRKADNVTGLFAERQLQLDLERLKKEGKQGKGILLRIGVDNFKEINERYGMETGDVVLKMIAECMKQVAEGNNCYRLDGDEFVMLLDEVDEQKARKKYHRTRILIEEQRRVQGYQNFYTISAGVVGFCYDDADFEKLCTYSEFALGIAKKNGKNCSYIFSMEDYEEYLKSIKIQEKLRYSVNHGFEGFEVYYQPIVSLKSGQVVGAEALLRFSSREYGMLSPGIFIPVLEESGLIIPVGEWVYRTAMRQTMEWQKVMPRFRININLSFIQICKSDVVSGIMASIEELGIEPSTVLFEFTESGMISYDDSVQRLLDVLNENEVKIALDDFGTGYSSLAYLQNLKVNLLKLDRGFTAKAVVNDFDYNLIGHIVDMAHSVGLQVCFEGIETEEELQKLRKLEPDYIQGFYYGRPVNKDTFYEDNLKRFEA